MDINKIIEDLFNDALKATTENNYTEKQEALERIMNIILTTYGVPSERDKLNDDPNPYKNERYRTPSLHDIMKGNWYSYYEKISWHRCYEDWGQYRFEDVVDFYHSTLALYWFEAINKVPKETRRTKKNGSN